MDNILEFKKEVKKLIDDKTLIKKDKDIDGYYNIFFHVVPVADNENEDIIKELLAKYNFQIINHRLVDGAMRKGKYLNCMIVFK